MIALVDSVTFSHCFDMNMYVVVVLFTLISISVALPPSVTKQYRGDYVYNKKTDAFYKLHTAVERGRHANSYCQLESAELMIPTTHEDIVQVHLMLKQFPDIARVWIGEDGRNHESAEEQPMIDLSSIEGTVSPMYSPTRDEQCDIMTRHGEIMSVPCFWYMPYVCKVNAKDAPYDKHCGVYAANYTYEPSVGSCYKISAKAYSWNQAYAECRNEGAHLVVINSEAEALIVRHLIITVTFRFDYSQYFFAGFRADETTHSRKFKTIFNQTLEEAGFNQWSPNEPNDARGQEYCGSIYRRDGKFNDITCQHRMPFICEKEVLSSYVRNG